MKFPQLSLRDLFWLVLVAALVPSSLLAGEEDVAALKGAWKVTKATSDGKPDEDPIGSVYRFDADKTLEVFQPTYEARLVFRVDLLAQDPPTLVSYFFTPKFAGSGICRLKGDTLRWRTSDKEQRLSFTTDPKGKWNEYHLRRLTDAEMKSAIERLARERLLRKSDDSH
jgi:hypothetical protein